MKSKTRPRKFYCELYRTHFLFCVGWSQPEFEKYYNKNCSGGADISDHSGGTFLLLTDSNREVLIWTDGSEDADLVHECVHAANITLKLCGVHPSFENDEAQAYLTTLIYKKARLK